MKKIFLSFFPAFLCALAIFIGSILSLETVNKVKLLNWDKTVHLLAYFLLCNTILYGLHSYVKSFVKQHYFYAFCFSFIYGIFMEFLQQQIKLGRSADFFDIIANSTGAIIALFVYTRIHPFLPKVRF